jgi:hypothetical protein
MKNLILFALLSLPLTSEAQNYLLKDYDHDLSNSVASKEERGFNMCQWDQNQLYVRAIDSSKTILQDLAQRIDLELYFNRDSMRLPQYYSIFQEKLFNHILLNKMKLQLEKKSLFKRHQAAADKKTTSVLEIKGIKVDLDEEISKTLESVVDFHRLKEASFDTLKEEILNDTLQTLVKGAFGVAISSAARTTIMNFLAGNISKDILKKALVSNSLEMGGEILVSAGKASLLTALTFPLHAYRLSDEDGWLDLVEKAPALLLNPDWKTNLEYGVGHAIDWEVQCRTMLWKPKEIERIFDKMLKRHEESYNAQIRFIRSLPDDVTHMKIKLPPQAVDGTYVSPKFIPKYN